MNERIKELLSQAGVKYVTMPKDTVYEKFAELIVQECADIVEQAKKSPFVSLDDAKRMSHFVDVTKKKIKQHFGVEE